MSYSLNINNQLATFQFEVSAEDFSHELEKEIFRSKDKLNLSVYRDGKVPPEIMQQMYDRNELLKRVINTVIGNEYEKALIESGYTPLTAPLAKVINCKKGEPFTFTVETVIKPEIQLGNYVGIQVGKPNFDVSEEEVNQVLQKFVHQHAITTDITDRSVINGDHVIIDFEGFLHGRAFKGNKADNFPLIVGSHSFIPGFEEELIGVGVNEAKDFTVTYPTDYRIDTLAGQEVVFRCIVRRITQVQIPDLSDELVKAHTKFETIDTYKDSIRKTLELQKRVLELKKKENSVLKEIVEASSLEINPVLFEQEEKRLEQEQQAQLKNKGISIEKHLKMLGITQEQYNEQLKQLAVRRVKTRLLLLEIANRERIQITEEEFNKEITQLAKTLKKSEEAFKHPFSKQQIGNEVKIQKALRFVMEHSVEVSEAQQQ